MGETPAGCAHRALQWGLLGLPSQVLGTMLAVALLATGHAAAAGALLDPGIWVTVALLGVARSEQLAQQLSHRGGDDEPAVAGNHERV
jgi:hypothetical protein